MCHSGPASGSDAGRAAQAWWLVAAVLLPACAPFQPLYHPDPGAERVVLRGDTSQAWGSSSGAPCLPGVSRALNRLSTRGTPLGFHLGGAASVGGYRQHWQGVQRSSPDTGYLFVSRSGGSPALVVVRLERESASTGIVAAMAPEAGFTHAGGIALVGQTLAIPLQGGGRSAVVFYDVSHPESPRPIGRLDRREVPPPSTPGDASAVGLVRLQDRRYLLVLGVHSSKLIEFYRSTGRSRLDSSLAFERLGVIQNLDVGGFQSLTLLTQCDGTLFLVGTHNTAMPPPSRGRDHVHWYRLVSGSDAVPHLRKAGERWLHCVACNLAAGAGFFITSRRDLVLYATEFWHRKPDDWVRIEEFGPEPDQPLAEGPP